MSPCRNLGRDDSLCCFLIQLLALRWRELRKRHFDQAIPFCLRQECEEMNVWLGQTEIRKCEGGWVMFACYATRTCLHCSLLYEVALWEIIGWKMCRSASPSFSWSSMPTPTPTGTPAPTPTATIPAGGHGQLQVQEPVTASTSPLVGFESLSLLCSAIRGTVLKYQHHYNISLTHANANIPFRQRHFCPSILGTVGKGRNTRTPIR
ncbi:hypothetical protein CPC08DRAFT_205289 [Agrocybe pediades]|nr:hypothetical protein CPC08DRAFT_205289 [Agrocybe pediades]